MSEPFPNPESEQSSQLSTMPDPMGQTPARRSRAGWWVVGIVLLAGIGVASTIASVGGMEEFQNLLSPTLVEVTGTVTFNGKPMTDGFIQTYYERPGFMGGLAAIKSDGTFKLETNGDPGLFSGTHRVIVKWMDNSTPPRDLLPQKYADPQTSPFRIKVTRQGPNRVQLELAGE